MLDNNNIPVTSHQTPQVNTRRPQTAQGNRRRPKRQENVSGNGIDNRYNQVDL